MPSRIAPPVQMNAEKAFVDGAAEEGRIVVHPTTCYGVRECGGSETFDQSCHWGTDGRYVCLRCASLSLPAPGGAASSCHYTCAALQDGMGMRCACVCSDAGSCCLA